MSVLIGIDLGTSTTEAAIFRNGKPEAILNLEGESIIPSAVGIDEAGNWVAGARAKAQYLLAPERTAVEVKRKTGTGEKITLGKGKYDPVDLQEKLLSYVRTYASEYLGESVDRAVISVPAYFDHIQRAETILAGEKAGFTVDRIINEPTAAAMSYGLEHMEEDSHVLVYDLGGGTFDVTLLEMFSGVLEVKASAGDNQLGGKDFDELLINELCSRFQKKYRVDLRKDKMAVVRLKEEAEKCKIALSEQDSCQVLLPAICLLQGKPQELNEIVTREAFEKITRPLLERTHRPIDTVLEDAGLDESDIDHIILVGGSTRMPMVQRDLEEYLHQQPMVAVHPELAVSMGAAIQAGIISGEIDPAESLVMTDVSAFSLGVRAGMGDGTFEGMSVILPRNITIPAKRTETYYTAAPGQTMAQIEVYQGESRLVRNNHFLGDFMVRGIPPRPRGMEKIDVTFAYDLNGMLKVTAQIVSTGKEAEIEINTHRAEKKVDTSSWKDASGAKEYRTLIRTAERILRQEKTQAGQDRVEIERETESLKVALIENNLGKAKEIAGRLMRLVER